MAGLYERIEAQLAAERQRVKALEARLHNEELARRAAEDSARRAWSLATWGGGRRGDRE